MSAIINLVVYNLNAHNHKPLHCSYSEASYFDGYHYQHIAAFEEHKRLKAIERRNRVAYERSAGERRRNSRSLEFFR